MSKNNSIPFSEQKIENSESDHEIDLGINLTKSRSLNFFMSNPEVPKFVSRNLKKLLKFKLFSQRRSRIPKKSIISLPFEFKTPEIPKKEVKSSEKIVVNLKKSSEKTLNLQKNV